MGPDTTTIDVDVHKTLEIGGLVLHINTIWATVVAGIVVLGLGFWVRRRATSGVPSRGQLLCETAISAVQRQVDARIGPTGRRIVPLAVTLFFFVLIANWLALIPTGSHDRLPAPTGDVNLTFAIAAFVVLLVHVASIRTRGLRGYLRHYVQPAWWLLPIRLVEEVVKPVTLALRLFGTVFSGALMLILILELFPSALAPVPMILWKLFELLIGAVQAFIFSLLTILYFEEAVRPEEEAQLTPGGPPIRALAPTRSR
ncbi:MAG TPA: F0F1 ATP synthase subunit A [Acidimicrobiales bacterium]